MKPICLDGVLIGVEYLGQRWEWVSPDVAEIMQGEWRQKAETGDFRFSSVEYLPTGDDETACAPLPDKVWLSSLAEVGFLGSWSEVRWIAWGPTAGQVKRQNEQGAKEWYAVRMWPQWWDSAKNWTAETIGGLAAFLANLAGEILGKGAAAFLANVGPYALVGIAAFVVFKKVL